MISELTLGRFCYIRNESPHQSNLQFSIDLREAGIEQSELGEAKKYGYETMDAGWYWHVPGFTLVEVCGRLVFWIGHLSVGDIVMKAEDHLAKMDGGK